MKVILDTNIWISILLSPASLTTNKMIEEAFLAKRFITVVPEDLINEIREATRKSSWLAARISPGAVEALIDVFHECAIVTTGFTDASDTILRDVRDDYLIRASRANHVDILVSGDDDVLAHAGNEPFAILSPSAFVGALQALANE